MGLPCLCRQPLRSPISTSLGPTAAVKMFGIVESLPREDCGHAVIVTVGSPGQQRESADIQRRVGKQLVRQASKSFLVVACQSQSRLGKEVVQHLRPL